MNRTLLASVLISLLVSCGGKKKEGKFELKGNFTNAKGGETLYLEKLSGANPVIVDSAVIKENGNFEFEGYTPRIGFYRIKLNAQNFAMLVLDSSDAVTVNGDIKDLNNTYRVEGSPESKLFVEYNTIAKKRDQKLDSLNKAFQMLMEGRKADSKIVDSISKLFEPPYEVIVGSAADEIIAKIKDSKGMYASLMAIQSLEPDKYVDTYKILDQDLFKKYPLDNNVKMFHDVVSKTLATMVGQQAPDIRMNTPDGKELSLSSFKGKVVLIDFWASWCGPCRKEMPAVVKAYEKYRGKGFEIFGVSLDQDKDRWTEAIVKDGITWPQVSDLKYWGSDAARMYNVQGIPYTVLLDKEGKIIAKNLRGAALEKKLEEVLE